MKLIHKIFAIVSLAFLGLGFPGLTFATGTVNLGAAENFAILAKTGISINGVVAVAGDIGVSSATASFIAGFNPHMDVSNKFSTSAFVNGKLYVADYATVSPTLGTAVNDMETAYAEAASRPVPTTTGRRAGDIGGLTFTPGLYKWNTGVTINSDSVLSGGPEDIWVFQIAENLDVISGVKIILADGAQAKNIFWQVAGQTIIGANTVFIGNILGQMTIVLEKNATIHGRLLSQTAVTLDTNTVNKPGSEPVSFAPNIVIPTTQPTLPVSGTSTLAIFPVPALAPVLSVQSLRSQLDTLLATLQTLMAQAKSAGISLPSEARQFIKSPHNFTQNLSLGSKGREVSDLQLFLIEKNIGLDAKVLVATGATGNFGLFTKKALIEFQKSVGITPASGYFGQKTMSYINSL